MAIDYGAIANDQARLERTASNSIRTLANLYAEPAHFVFELLQNAEDAIRRRPSGGSGSRAVTFQLTPQHLRVSHYGEPFSAADVQAICSVGETTKELTDIGRFGIGFKSVYAFTDRPEIHSGAEDFAIERFVRPVAVPPIARDVQETVILVPLPPDDGASSSKIAVGLERLGARALLFLRQIEEIRWSVQGARSGFYLRQSTELASGVRQVTVIGQEECATGVEEEWLVVSRPVVADDGREAGQVEVAFLLVRDEGGRQRIQQVTSSRLVVFFPTVVETHLGFVIQGPYRTTPSRDNVPPNDQWNQRLVAETGNLVIDALRWLRDASFLDAAALRCLPLDRAKFGDSNMFAPLFTATKKALSSEQLLPRLDTGHVAATRSRLGRTQELRDLFSSAQLAALYESKQETVWLSADITQDRTPELRRYLMQEIAVPEVTPEVIVPRLRDVFLEAQSDGWITRLYEFLSGQPALRPRLGEVPLVRLENGKHVPAKVDGQPQAFLPGEVATGFPTVRPAVCLTKAARDFLQSLGVTEPDPVDDVIRNVLPKYQKGQISVGNADYEVDIHRILAAFATDSKAQREKLIVALRGTPFVMAVDAGDSSKCVSMPTAVYLATERIEELFEGVDDVLLVDDSYSCLRGENVRALLEACGAARYLQPEPVEGGLSPGEQRQIRCKAGLERATWSQLSNDVTLRGLEQVLTSLARLHPDAQRDKARALWEALADVEDRRGTRAFLGKYTWRYSHETKTAPFDTAFVRRLNDAAWVPDGYGALQQPGLVFFDSLGWKTDLFLLSKIRFKPPIIEQLAKEAGIELGVLDLLKKLGVTNEADLRARLGVKSEATPANDAREGGRVEDAAKRLPGDAAQPTRASPDSATPEPPPSSGGGGGVDPEAGADSGGESRPGAGSPHGGEQGGGRKSPGQGDARPAAENMGSRQFISYVAAHSDDEEPDPDGLDQRARMALEAKAIDVILTLEPEWNRTPTHNAGYDLYRLDAGDQAIQWCEVKAMTGTLHKRPVGLSHTQFKCAQAHGESYWLYIVERTGTADVHIVRIQDPAGKARTFTFDHGWLQVAGSSAVQDDGED